ncbi:MAG: SDR family oxidoreductase [Bacillota bacterium]|nr:SDR family oxidoreductase [Bacillota bacterium]
MANDKCALITGSSGYLGGALLQAFHDAGYRVIGIDIKPPDASIPIDAFVEADLNRVATDDAFAEAVASEVRSAIGGMALHALINNAAVQLLGRTEELRGGDWTQSLNVNVVAPFALVREFLPELEACHGSVVNVASIHALLTKPRFIAYATSKAALVGLTRALAVDLGPRVRVNAVCPAAIDTGMLRAGFDGREDLLQKLRDMHPARAIGTTSEVAAFVLMLASSEFPLMTGGVYPFDGAIGSRLHDPE